MSTSDYNSLLTPAARQMLSELMRDLHEQILRDAAVAAMRATGDLREITVSDIARSYSRLQGGRGARRSTLIDRILQAYEVVALMMGAYGLLGYFMVRYLDLQVLQGREDLLVVVAASGIVLFLMIGLLRRSRSLTSLFRLLPSTGTEREVSTDSIGEFIARWVELELALRSTAVVRLGESASGVPVSQLLTILTSAEVLSASDANTLKKLLSMRNAVVHGRGGAPPDEIRHAMREIQEVLDRLPHTRDLTT
jgi:hypothetical protein